MPFLNGLGFGLVLILSLGPVFFLLIQTSIEKGFKKAAFTALGVSLADLIFVVLIMKGMASVLEQPAIKFWAGIIGVTLLIVFGLYSFFKKPQLGKASIKAVPDSYSKSLATGLLFNLFNPSSIFFWLSLVSIVQINFGYSGNQKMQFFSGVLLAIISTDLTKSYLADKLKRFSTVRAVSFLNKVVGVILVGFGVVLLTQLF